MVKIQAPEAAMKYAAFIRKTKPEVKKIFLFGSYVKGTACKDSDIDLAIVFESLPDAFDAQVELMKMRRKFDTRIEPHPFDESDFNPTNPLANEILESGVEIV